MKNSSYDIFSVFLYILSGKAKAMELVLTGATIDAVQAERDGLVCRVVPNEKVHNCPLPDFFF